MDRMYIRGRSSAAWQLMVEAAASDVANDWVNCFDSCLVVASAWKRRMAMSVQLESSRHTFDFAEREDVYQDCLRSAFDSSQRCWLSGRCRAEEKAFDFVDGGHLANMDCPVGCHGPSQARYFCNFAHVM